MYSYADLSESVAYLKCFNCILSSVFGLHSIFTIKTEVWIIGHCLSLGKNVMRSMSCCVHINSYPGKGLCPLVVCIRSRIELYKSIDFNWICLTCSESVDVSIIIHPFTHAKPLIDDVGTAGVIFYSLWGRKVRGAASCYVVGHRRTALLCDSSIYYPV